MTENDTTQEPRALLREAITRLAITLGAREKTRKALAERTGVSLSTLWRAEKQSDVSGSGPSPLDKLLELYATSFDIDIHVLVTTLARFLEERSRAAGEVFEARHRGKLMLDAARASGLGFITLSLDDAALLIEGVPEVKLLLEEAARQDGAR